MMERVRFADRVQSKFAMWWNVCDVARSVATVLGHSYRDNNDEVVHDYRGSIMAVAYYPARDYVNVTLHLGATAIVVLYGSLHDVPRIFRAGRWLQCLRKLYVLSLQQLRQRVAAKSANERFEPIDDAAWFTEEDIRL